MSIPKKEKGSGNMLSFFLSGIFFLIIVWFTYQLDQAQITAEVLQEISFLELLILTLAVFRLTRLLVYDKVAQFIRDLWLNTEEKTEQGIVYVHRTKPQKGIRRLLADLFGCPWCIGVWAAVFTVGIYLLYPITWYFFLLLAIAGASTLIQLTANLIGWKAEIGKQTSTHLSKQNK